MTTTSTTTTPPFREIKDANGRVYRVGENPREILRGPRSLMMWLPWAAMFGISVAEYAYGSAEDTLSSVHHWTSTNTFWLLGIWTVFQAAVSFPTGRLRERGVLSPRAATMCGAVLAGLGFVALSHAPNLAVAIGGFGVLGGAGAGMVYSTCINIVGKWYPERRGARTGFVNGGFAYGAVPLIFVFTYWFDEGNYHQVLDLVGVYVLLVVFVCGWFFRDPPKNWWPAEVDPVEFHRNRKANPGLAKNPPAVKQYEPMEAVRTGMLPLMWISMLMIAGVSIFGISFQVPFAKDIGFGPLVAASSAGILSLVNGVGRAVVGWVSDRLGRKETLIAVLVIEGLAQFGVLWAGDSRNEVLFLAFAFVSGFGSGGFFPMFAALVPDYFGENNNASNYGLVYSSKLISGLAGAGLGSIVITAWGYHGAYLLAGFIGLGSAGLALMLRQPGRRRLRDIEPNPEPITRDGDMG
jgi:MFS family permease